MELSKGEILTLEQIIHGNKNITAIALALKKSNKQIYVYIKSLANKDIISNTKTLELKKTTHLSLLLQLISKIPNLAPALSDSGIPILTKLLNPITIGEIIKETKYKKTIIYKKLEEARKRNIIRKNISKFEINDKLWPILKEFLKETTVYESKLDSRIPAGAIIYYKKNNELVFSCKEELNETKTAFSVYQDYGIKLFNITNFYYIPKRKLSKEDILKHAIYIAEKDNDIKYLIVIALFYAKFKKKINFKHSILSNLSLVFKGKKIEGYPTYQEIKDRAEVYKIKV